jgi:hypothetical protein
MSYFIDSFFRHRLYFCAAADRNPNMDDLYADLPVKAELVADVSVCVLSLAHRTAAPTMA